MKIHRVAALIGLATFGMAAARASVLMTVTDDVLVAGDPTQLGRLSRDGVPSDWSGPKAFPGAINPTTSYHYRTYFIPTPITPYIQITVDDPNAAIFSSAYKDSYNPASKSTNYLGDGGFSGNFFPGAPLFFQVFVPTGSDLVLVINDPGASNVGLGKPYSLVVEGFTDTNFSDPTPEPSSLFLSGGGLAAAALAARRRRRAAATKA